MAQRVVDQGLAQAGSSTSLTLGAQASAFDGVYADMTLELEDGRSRSIDGYDGFTKVATVATWNATHVLLPGVGNNNYATTPHSVALDLTGDVELVFRYAADDWTPAAVQRVMLQDGAVRRWMVQIELTGRIAFYARPVGGAMFEIAGSPAPSLQAASGVLDGQPKWIKINRTLTTGVIRIFYGDDGVNWTQLGANVSGGQAGVAIASEGTTALLVGHSSATLSPIGKVYYAEVRNGIDGAVVAKFDPINDALLGVTSFVSSNGETWTVNQSGGTPAVLGGTPDSSTAYQVIGNPGASVEIQRAIFETLRADSALAALLAADPNGGSPSVPAVFDNVPQASASEDATRFPYVVVGEDTAGEFDTDDTDGQETTITLHVWDRYRGRKRVKAILDAIYDVLHDAELSIVGQHPVYCFWEFSQTLQEDGPNSQHAVTRFRIATQES